MSTTIDINTPQFSKIAALKIICGLYRADLTPLGKEFEYGGNEWFESQIFSLMFNIIMERREFYSIQELLERVKLCHIKAYEFEDKYPEVYLELTQKYARDEEFFSKECDKIDAFLEPIINP